MIYVQQIYFYWIYFVLLIGVNLISIKTDCISDCQNFNDYDGLRSATKDGHKCQPWKNHKNGSYKSRKTNVCYAKNEKSYCSVGDKLAECSIPKCEDMKKLYPCITVTVKAFNNTLHGKLKHRNINTFLGYVVMLYLNDECVTSYIYGYLRPKHYHIEIRSLFISCFEKRYIITKRTEYWIRNLQSYTTYQMYIFGLISLNEITKIKKMIVKTKGSNNCYQDCIQTQHKKYWTLLSPQNGIRHLTETGKKCINAWPYTFNNFCKGSCYYNFSKQEKCRLHVCNIKYNEKPCVHLKISQSFRRPYSLHVQLIKPNEALYSTVNNFLIMLHKVSGVQSCLKAILIGNYNNWSKKQFVTDLYYGCISIVYQPNLSLVEFTGLKNHDYRIYAAMILENKQISPILQENIKKCFTDCQENDKYDGLVSVTKNGKICKPWKNHSNKTYQQRISNFCYAKGTKSFCSTGNGLAECAVPQCSTVSMIAEICFKISAHDITDHSARIVWATYEFVQEEKVDGYVMLLHNWEDVCELAVVLGIIEPDYFHLNVRSLFLSCKKVVSSKTITTEYTIEGLKSIRSYIVYVFATFRNDEASTITRYDFVTKFSEFCFNDCLETSTYNGIRRATSNGEICDNYPVTDKVTHSWCTNKASKFPGCYVGNQYKMCNIPFCENTRKDVYCLHVNWHLKFLRHSSLKIKWKLFSDNYDTKISGYLLLVYSLESMYSCELAVISGYNLTDQNLGKMVKNFYTGCAEIKYEEYITEYETFSLKKLETTHQIFVAAIIDKDNVGLIRKHTFKYTSCTMDCQNESYYGLRSVKKNGELCKPWKDHSEEKYRQRLSNLCYAMGKKSYCSIGIELAECAVPRCDTMDKEVAGCVSPFAYVSNNHIEVIWNKILFKKKVIGYILLLHNDQSECLIAAIFGSLKPDLYDIEVKSLFLSCSLKEYHKFIEYKYEFKTMLNYLLFHVYIFTTYSKREISKIVKIPFKLKNPNTDDLVTSINVKYNSINIKWGYFAKSPLIGNKNFLVLLYETGNRDVCEKAVIIWYNETTLNEEVKDLYKDCNENVFTRDIMEYTFEDLKLQQTYQINLASINESTIGKVKELKNILIKYARNCIRHCIERNEQQGTIYNYVGQVPDCKKVIHGIWCINTNVVIKNDYFISGQHSEFNEDIGVTGMIYLLYGSEKCYFALHTNNMNNSLISGFYVACEKIIKKDVVDNKFQLEVSSKIKNYTFYIIPIINETSYGYVTRMPINISFKVPSIEYVCLIVRTVIFFAFLFLIMLPMLEERIPQLKLLSNCLEAIASKFVVLDNSEGDEQKEDTVTKSNPLNSKKASEKLNDLYPKMDMLLKKSMSGTMETEDAI